MASTTNPQVTFVIHAIQHAQHAVDQAALSAFHALLLNSTKHQRTSALILAIKLNILSLVQTLYALAATTHAKLAQALQALNAFLALEACTSTR